MGRMILKERVFTPTGRNLGKFSAVDLEPFDLQYTESDEPPKQEGQNATGGRKRVPDPVDSDPLKPITSPDSSNNGGGVDPFSKKDGQDRGDGAPPDKWNLNGTDMDDNEQMGEQPPPAESLGGSGDGEGGEPPSSDEDWGGGNSQEKTPPRGPSGGQSGPQGGDPGQEQPGGDSGEGGQQGGKSGGGSQGGRSTGGSPGDPGEDEGDGEDGDNPGQQGGSFGGSGSGGSQGGQPGDDNGDEPGQGGGSGEGGDEGEEPGYPGGGDDGPEPGDTPSKPSGGQSGGQQGGQNPGQQPGQPGNPQGGSQGGDGGQPGQPGGSSNSGDGGPGSGQGRSISQLLGDDQEDDEDNASDLAAALKKMDSERSESAKAKERADQRQAQEEKERRRKSPSREESQAAKDIVTDAVKRSKEEKAARRSGKKKDPNDYYDDDDMSGYDDLEDSMLSAMGAGAMTSLFNPAMKSDWRSRLEMIFDQATGMEIVTNPNLINKKIENAPPGREDDVPAISKIAVLLDCSGSMGATAFKQVIAHIDTMLKVRKMNNVVFHIICWGDRNLKLICDTHTKVKGKMFKQTIMKMHAQNWGTSIGPAFQAASQLIKNPDAIMVFTDMGIHDPYSSTDDPVVARYMKKYKKKIIYILTHDASMSYLKQFDPYAFNKKQWVKFKKGK